MKLNKISYILYQISYIGYQILIIETSETLSLLTSKQQCFSTSIKNIVIVFVAVYIDAILKSLKEEVVKCSNGNSKHGWYLTWFEFGPAIKFKRVNLKSHSVILVQKLKAASR